MRTPIFVRTLTDDETRVLEQGLRSRDAAMLRRCQIVLANLAPRSRRPHTIHVAFDAGGAEALRELVHRSPRDFGRPTSIWTLHLLAEVAAEQGLTEGVVSHETIRQTLRRLGVRWQRAKEWLRSPDPAYAQKTSGGIG